MHLPKIFDDTFRKDVALVSLEIRAQKNTFSYEVGRWMGTTAQMVWEIHSSVLGKAATQKTDSYWSRHPRLGRRGPSADYSFRWKIALRCLPVFEEISKSQVFPVQWDLYIKMLISSKSCKTHKFLEMITKTYSSIITILKVSCHQGGRQFYLCILAYYKCMCLL